MTEALTFRTAVPGPPLSNFVEMLWYWESPLPLPSAKEHVLPTGTVEFVVRLSHDCTRVYDPRDVERFETYSGAVVTGTQSKYFVLDKNEQDALLGVHFKPGGAFPFFGVPAAELQDRHVSLDDLWGRIRAQTLRSDLLEAATVEEKFRVMERHLMAAASRPLVHHPAVRYALGRIRRAEPTLAISELADQVGLSQRRLIQVFSEQVGLTPKLFHRVSRFQEVIRSVQSHQDVDWMEVALSCGYFDQAHFIHDFRDFSGFSPTAYLKRRTEHLNHIPLD